MYAASVFVDHGDRVEGEEPHQWAYLENNWLLEQTASTLNASAHLHCPR